MQEVKARHSEYGGISDHKCQISNEQILEETIEGVEVPKNNARGVFSAINEVPQTDQVVDRRFIRRTWQH